MKVVILTSRRADNGQRDEVWRWLRAELERTYPDWPIYEGHYEDDGLFNRSIAVNRAAAAAGAWDVAVLSDADCLAPRTAEAVEIAWTSGLMTMAHNHYYALSEAGTAEILAGRDQPRVELAEWHEGDLGVAQCVVRRDLWERVGGHDERFYGWGWQDVAFHYACRGMAGDSGSGNGQIRLDGPLFHLWHPINTTTEPGCREMGLEYQAAFQEGRMKEFLRDLPASRHRSQHSRVAQ